MVNVFWSQEYENGEYYLGFSFWMFRLEKYSIDARLHKDINVANNHLLKSVMFLVQSSIEDLSDMIIPNDGKNFPLVQEMDVIKRGRDYIATKKEEPLEFFKYAKLIAEKAALIIQSCEVNHRAQYMMIAMNVIKLSDQMYNEAVKDKMYIRAVSIGK